MIALDRARDDVQNMVAAHSGHVRLTATAGGLLLMHPRRLFHRQMRSKPISELFL